jgi:hypothetical protein
MDCIHPQVSWLGDGGGGDIHLALGEMEVQELTLGGRSQGSLHPGSTDFWSFAGKEVPETDPRKIIHGTLTYFTNSCGRMDYPRYRCEGLPVTSSLAESLVKQVSKRVKGTEKFWNNGSSGEAILQLRAAVISDDERLRHWIFNRPISLFSPRCRLTGLANST